MPRCKKFSTQHINPCTKLLNGVNWPMEFIYPCREWVHTPNWHQWWWCKKVPILILAVNWPMQWISSWVNWHQHKKCHYATNWPNYKYNSENVEYQIINIYGILLWFLSEPPSHWNILNLNYMCDMSSGFGLMRSGKIKVKYCVTLPPISIVLHFSKFEGSGHGLMNKLYFILLPLIWWILNFNN